MKNLSVVDTATIFISILALFISCLTLFREVRNGKINKRNEAEKLLNEALDSMNNGQPNTEVLWVPYDTPLNQEQISYFEEARRKNRACAELRSQLLSALPGLG